MSEWHTKHQDELEEMIMEFKTTLPGWWYSMGECEVSCHASCAPTVESPHIHFIREAGDPFDAGFHADLRQPSYLWEALQDVMLQATSAIEAYQAKPKEE